MNTKDIFINNLKFYRKKEGLTQAQLATQIDKSFNYINGIECGTSFPPPETIDKICNVLKIKSVQLFDENGCDKNILLNDTSKFYDRVSMNISSRLKEYIKEAIREEMRDLLGLEKR